VDGVWKWAEDEPAVRDDEGNYINVMEVHEYVPENLESLSGFEPPASPPSRCVSHVHALLVVRQPALPVLCIGLISCPYAVMVGDLISKVYRQIII